MLGALAGAGFAQDTRLISAPPLVPSEAVHVTKGRLEFLTGPAGLERHLPLIQIRHALSQGGSKVRLNGFDGGIQVRVAVKNLVSVAHAELPEANVSSKRYEFSAEVST